MTTPSSGSPWKNVWVVGASFGIGRAFAELCAAQGTTVIVSARSADTLDALAEKNSKLVPVPVDVTDPDQVRRAVETIAGKGLTPDLTLYNAGFYEPVDDWRVDGALFARHVSVNYLGAVHVLDHLMPRLAERGAGQVAMVASVSGYCGLPKAAAYGPTKAALISLCESLKPEFDRVGVTLNVVNPGFVETRMTEKNKFKMPFLLKPEQAAAKIYDGLQSGSFEVAFPRPMVRRLKILRLLPYSLYFKVMRKITA